MKNEILEICAEIIEYAGNKEIVISEIAKMLKVIADNSK